MVTVGLYYDVVPGKAPLFRSKFEEIVRLLETMPGHRASHLYQRVEDHDSFAILSEWHDRQAFLEFLRSDAFRQTTAWGREEILRSAPRHEVYTHSEDLGRPS